MSTKTNEELLAAYEKLPESIQKIIAEADTESQLIDLGDKHKLRIDQTGELADEVGLILLGFTSQDQFKSHLVERLGISELEVEALAADVNAQIFLPIQDALRNLKSPTENTDTVKTEAATDSKSLFEEKMGKLFRIPREEVDLNEAGVSKPKGNDPYLEPTN